MKSIDPRLKIYLVIINIALKVIFFVFDFVFRKSCSIFATF